MVLQKDSMQLDLHRESIDLVSFDEEVLANMDRDVRRLLGKGPEGVENSLNPPSGTSVESKKKRRDEDEEDNQNCFVEEVHDLRYLCVLKNLKEDGKSYILEYEEDGVPVKIKYEGDLSVDVEPVRKLRSATQKVKSKYEGDLSVDVEPVRKLRSATQKVNKPSDHMFVVEDQRKREMGKKQANKFKSKKGDNAKSSIKPVPDLDCDLFWQHIKISKHGIVLKFGDHEVWYDDGGKKNVGIKGNDEAFSRVEFIDHDTFYKKKTPSFSSKSLKDEEDDNETEHRYGSSQEYDEETSKKNKGSISSPEGPAEFKEEVMTALSKPYNKQEHDELLQAVKHRRQEERHLDLRNGRERSYSIEKTGKSYLDHYPVFRQKLAQVQHDELKCLNLLRGFYLFLQQAEPPFRPWEDEECCAITPGSATKKHGNCCHDPGPSCHHGFSR